MKDGVIKRILYKTGVIPLYSNYQQYRYDKKIEKRNNPDRWYFKFLPIKKNKIVFDNFLGKGYGDNPKAIAEEVIRQGLKWDLVWLTKQNEEMPEQIRQVEYGSPEAMRELATAKMWIFNCRNVKHPQKRRKQKYLQTWHGGSIPLKKMEGMTDNLDKSYIEKAKIDGKICDFFLSSCKTRTELLNKYFWLSKNVNILEYGTPKEDILYDNCALEAMKNKVIKKLCLDNSKTIILYMPTFRDNLSCDGLDMDYTEIINAFEKRTNRKAVMLVRFHPNVATRQKVQVLDNRIVDVTSYPEANDLFAVADFGISDYSDGIIFGLPRIGKPSFIYASDYFEYKNTRGLTSCYNNLPININKTTEELAVNILTYDEKKYFQNWAQYFKNEKYYEQGNASIQVVGLLKTLIK